jgi:hypothetical protein
LTKKTPPNKLLIRLKLTNKHPISAAAAALFSIGQPNTVARRVNVTSIKLSYVNKLTQNKVILELSD